MALMRIRQLSLRDRFQHLSLDLQEGEVLGVIGPNGSGKTSLLESLAGLHDVEGEITLDGRPLGEWPARERAKAIGFLPQLGASAWSIRVADVVRLGRLPWGDDDPHEIAAAMAATGVSDLSSRPIDQLSGGEQARVWLARVLAGRPRVLLADEPLASLDLRHQHDVARALRDSARAGKSVVCSLHDLALAAGYCDRLALLDRGRLRALGTPGEVLEPRLLSEVYGLPIEVRLTPFPPLIAANPAAD